MLYIGTWSKPEPLLTLHVSGDIYIAAFTSRLSAELAIICWGARRGRSRIQTLFCVALPALNSSKAFGGLCLITKERFSITRNHTDVISGNTDNNTLVWWGNYRCFLPDYETYVVVYLLPNTNSYALVLQRKQMHDTVIFKNNFDMLSKNWLIQAIQMLI